MGCLWPRHVPASTSKARFTQERRWCGSHDGYVSPRNVLLACDMVSVHMFHTHMLSRKCKAQNLHLWRKSQVMLLCHNCSCAMPVLWTLEEEGGILGSLPLGGACLATD